MSSSDMLGLTGKVGIPMDKVLSVTAPEPTPEPEQETAGN